METQTKTYHPTTQLQEENIQAVNCQANDYQNIEAIGEKEPIASVPSKLWRNFSSIAPPIQKKANKTGLPPKLKAGVEHLSGIDMSDVKVHYNSSKPAQLQAHAFAQGTDIHIAPQQEKYLAHEAWHVVQQKQGRVQPTMQMKGKVNVNDDIRLEREADVMGNLAISRYHPTETEIPLSTRTISEEYTIQRAMGMEVEIPHPILTKDGKMFVGDTNIAVHYPYFKIVSDYRHGKVEGEKIRYSNIEFVMNHFNQLEGTEKEAITELNKRLSAMKDVFVRIDKEDEGSFKKFIPYSEQDALHFNEDYYEAVVGRNTGGIIHEKKPDDLFVHYTLGFALEDMADFSKNYLSKKEFNRSTENQKRATESLEVANEVIEFLKGKIHFDKEEDSDKVRGYISLVYMNVAAFHDQIANDNKGQIKNKTAALSRVPLGKIFTRLLSDPIKQILKNNFEHIDQIIANPLEKWNDDHVRQVNSESPEIKLGAYMKSAFGLHESIEQTWVFGGMNEVEIDYDNVSTGLIPVELRTFGKHYVNWDELEKDAIELLKYTRKRQKTTNQK